MKIINPSVEIIERNMDYPTLLTFIESIGRTCYKSMSELTKESGEKFIARLIKNGHESVLEHGHFTIRFICDRGVSHELVRHRNTAYSQESTRYCNYSRDQFGNEITVIKPSFFKEDDYKYSIWKISMEVSEQHYFMLLKNGAKPEEARTVLPNSLKTEIVFTMNIRELRTFLKLRTSPAAHPQMRELCIDLLKQLHDDYPIFFNDIFNSIIEKEGDKNVIEEGN